MMRYLDPVREAFEENYGVKLPTHKEVCPRCDGEGTHVNPGVDGNGLTHEDFAADPDFFEDYMSGVYDVRCEECHGQNVVDVVDEASLSDELRASWRGWLEEERSYRALVAAERRMGA